MTMDITDELRRLSDHWVASCHVKWPSSRSCIEVAQAPLTAGHGSEVASLIANMT